MKRKIIPLLLALAFVQRIYAGEKKPKVAPPSPLELFLENARKTPANTAPANGSLFSPSGPGLFLFHDLKAHTANDIVTIQINETDSATYSANTSTQKNTNVTMAAPGAFGLERSSHLDFTKLLDASAGLTFGGQGA